jgi:alpha-D-xyloside xylohydrolase
MPVFVKAGSIIPFGPELQYTSEKTADTITLNIYTGADASFNLYEDEGTNYNYEKGAFSIIPVKFNEATKTISIGDRQGSFNGMLQERIFRINILSSNKAKPLDFDASDKQVTYEGHEITIKVD